MFVFYGEFYYFCISVIYGGFDTIEDFYFKAFGSSCHHQRNQMFFFYLWKLKYALVALKNNQSKISTLEEQETIKENQSAKNVKASKKPNH